MRWNWLAGLVAIGAAFGATSAQGEWDEIGFLTCSLSDRRGEDQSEAAIEQRRHMLCSFAPSAGGADETYSGTYQSVGRDQQLLDKGTMIWMVRGTAATEMSPGLLQQTYAADPAAASVELAPLLGETNKAIILQALIHSEQQDAIGKQASAANVTIVFVALKLRSSST